MDLSAPRKDLGGWAKAGAGQVEHAAFLEAALQTQRIAVALCNLDSACAEAFSSLCVPNSRLFISVDSE